jgi:hypothetical protein
MAGAEQAAPEAIAGELPVVSATPTATSEPSTGDAESVATASTGAQTVSETTLDRVFGDHAEEWTAAAFDGVKFLVTLLLAAGGCFVARPRDDGRAEPRVRLRGTLAAM